MAWLVLDNGYLLCCVIIAISSTQLQRGRGAILHIWAIPLSFMNVHTL